MMSNDMWVGFFIGYCVSLSIDIAFRPLDFIFRKIEHKYFIYSTRKKVLKKLKNKLGEE